MGMSRGHHLSPATLTNMKLLLIIGKFDQQPQSPQGLSKSEIESKKAHLDCMWSFDKRMVPDKPEMTKKSREANISYANQSINHLSNRIYAWCLRSFGWQYLNNDILWKMGSWNSYFVSLPRDVMLDVEGVAHVGC